MNKIISLDNSSLEEIADNLLEASRDQGETDNQTLILWEYSTSQISQEKALIQGNRAGSVEVERVRLEAMFLFLLIMLSK